MVPPFVQRVALFVDEQQSVIEETLSLCPFDMIQFHGAESSSFVRLWGCLISKQWVLKREMS